MNPLVLSILAFASLGWALWVKFRQRKMVDLLLLLLLAVASSINEWLVYVMILDELPVVLHVVQMVACASLLPLLYMLLSRQLSPQSYNTTLMVLLWGLVACSLLPNILIYNPLESLVIPESGLKPFGFYVLSGGEKRLAFYTGDVAVIVQSVILLVFIGYFVWSLYRIGLRLNRYVWTFLAVSLLLALFAGVLSTMNYASLRGPVGKWIYFGTYTLISILLNVFIAMKFDLSLVQTEEGETVPDVDAYAQQQYEELAERFRRLMVEQALYRNPMITAERVTELLQTNRTYFARMMSTVVKMSFSDYLNELRLEYVEELLRDESISIADAAEQSGFASANYLTRRFKQKHGCTPSEWRKKNTIS